jgi:hypothetical protein
MKLLIECDENDNVNLDLKGSASDITSTIAMCMVESEDFLKLIETSIEIYYKSKK